MTITLPPHLSEKPGGQCHAEEEYFDAAIELVYLQHFPQGRLPEGAHEIPFEYTLPDQLPASFEGECCA